MKSKAQFSVEYLIIVGISLFFIAIFLVMFYRTSFQESKMKDAEYTVNLLAKSANEVYYLAPGTRTYVKAMIPTGITEITIGKNEGENEINFKVRIFGDIADIFAETKPIVYGDIPAESGLYTVFLEKQADGRVKIGALCLFKDYEYFYYEELPDEWESSSLKEYTTDQQEILQTEVTYLKLPMPEITEGCDNGNCWMCDLNTPCRIVGATFSVGGTPYRD